MAQFFKHSFFRLARIYQQRIALPFFPVHKNLIMLKQIIFPFLLLTFFSCFRIEGQGTRDTLAAFMMEPKELHEDFQLLRRVLTETHPGLYRYASKERMTRKMDSISLLFNKPMFFYDNYLILSELIADIRCAHTHISPRKNLESYYLNEIKTFPLMVFYMAGKYIVTVNGTGDTSIKPGFELLTINDRSVTDIRREIFRHLWADGYNETLKTKLTTEIYFPLFYYLSIERSETFSVTLRNLNGEEIKITVAAQRFKETLSFFRKNVVNKQILSANALKNKLDQRKGWRLSIRKDENVGVLRINAFGGGNSEEAARKKMNVFLDGCMKKLNKEEIKDLIIDLRYNGGGWDIQGVELFTYLMKEPARCYRRLHSISDSTEFLGFSDLSSEDRRNLKKELTPETDGTFSVKEEFSEQLKLQYPKPNRFTGQVYILMNGGSASTTSEFIAYAKSNKAAILIGEETGGANEGGNGGSFLNFELPHSRFSVGTPLLYYENEVVGPKQKGRGTMPDFAVPYNIEDILRGYDTQLNFTLELIRKSRGE